MGQIWRQSEVTQFFASVGRVIDQKWSKSLTWEDKVYNTLCPSNSYNANPGSVLGMKSFESFILVASFYYCIFFPRKSSARLKQLTGFISGRITLRRRRHASGYCWICNFFRWDLASILVSRESGKRIRNLLNPLSRVDIFDTLWKRNLVDVNIRIKTSAEITTEHKQRLNATICYSPMVF